MDYIKLEKESHIKRFQTKITRKFESYALAGQVYDKGYPHIGKNVYNERILEISYSVRGFVASLFKAGIEVIISNSDNWSEPLEGILLNQTDQGEYINNPKYETINCIRQIYYIPECNGFCVNKLTYWDKLPRHLSVCAQPEAKQLKEIIPIMDINNLIHILDGKYEYISNKDQYFNQLCEKKLINFENILRFL